MLELKILRNAGDPPISVPIDAVRLEINDPVSTLTNFDEVIQSLPRLETLVLYVTDYSKTDRTKSLSFLRGAKRLKELSLRSMACLQDCGSIVECRSLEWLGLSRHVTKVFDFKLLPSVASLRSLYVEMPSKSVMDQIPEAVQLTSLEARGGFKLNSLEILKGLVNLEQLKLWSGSLNSSAGLAGLQRLKVLNLGYSRLRDATDLGSVSGLRKMELVGNKSISNLNFVREGELEFLGMFEIPKLDSFKPISRLSRLKEIHCSAVVTDGDLSPIVKHPSLAKVILPGRYKAPLKKLRIDSSCVFKAGRETFKLTNKGPLVLETAGEAKEHLLKKLRISSEAD